MEIVAIRMPYSNEPYYQASINKRGISVSRSANTRLKAMMLAWEEYTYELYK